MSRMTQAGCELAAPTTSPGPEGAKIGSGVVTRDTATKRSGAASWKFDSGGTNQAVTTEWGALLLSPATYYMRVYIRVPALPGTNTEVMRIDSGTVASLYLHTDGTITLLSNGTQQGSASSAISTNTWYRLELKCTVDGSFNATATEFQLDGSSIATWTGSIALVNGDFEFGWAGFPGANTVLYADDFAVNNNSGASNNSWCGDGNVILMKPLSDSQRGSWTGGVGGTTNLFAAVDNTPPVGTATETDSTQIESVDSSGNNATDEYRGDCGSYTTAGIAAGDTINALQVWINHGEDVATNTKTGSFGLQANPTDGYSTFTFGADVGALGTFPTNWSWTQTVAYNVPSVTKGSSLILAVRKTDTGTRVASVDFLGCYVDYTVAATGHNVAVTTATETDSAQGVANAPKRRLVGLASETDASQALTHKKTLAATLASETDAAQALVRRKTEQITVSAETDAALIVRAPLRFALVTSTETDASIALTHRKTRAVTVSAETDSPIALTPRKSRAAATALETDAAIALKGKSKSITLAVETDAAQVIAHSKARAITLASETDLAITVAHSKARAVTLATETDLAIALTRVKASPVTLATETDSAFTITAVKGGGAKLVAVTLASETDAAIALGATLKQKAITLASEASLAVPVASRKARVIIVSTETDAAIALGQTLKRQAVVTVVESDTSIALVHQKSKALTASLETDSAFTVIRLNPHTILITTTNEADLAVAMALVGGRPPMSAAQLRNRLNKVYPPYSTIRGRQGHHLR